MTSVSISACGNNFDNAAYFLNEIPHVGTRSSSYFKLVSNQCQTLNIYHQFVWLDGNLIDSIGVFLAPIWSWED